jgi:hypothetical protein
VRSAASPASDCGTRRPGSDDDNHIEARNDENPLPAIADATDPTDLSMINRDAAKPP